MSTAAPALELADAFSAVRDFTEQLCETIGPEDAVVQSMPDASPVKWHLAHTTWFFETFLLMRSGDYRPADPQFQYLYNSYYNSVGPQYARPRRGLITRPTLDEVHEYRRRVNAAILEGPTAAALKRDPVVAEIMEIGLHHEQQHQELILTDLKHLLSHNPLCPVYRPASFTEEESAPAQWRTYEGGVAEIGHPGGGFAYDNESPRHRVYLQPFMLSSRPVTCGEYLDFIADGGYTRPELWLSEGWAFVQAEGLRAPLYWRKTDGAWQEFTLAGETTVDPSRPVCHLSYFEADAFARWADARLPTEAEWETAASDVPVVGNFVDTLLEADAPLHPSATSRSESAPLDRLYGDVWEWTSSSYAAYPGYKPAPGALGEYNGKFMCNQYVLRGGSCATHSSHIRPTYRNFFPATARWQFAGLRLARDL